MADFWVAEMALWAQAADPISGGAGWAGAGILGLVLAWLLLVHLPAKDKHIQTLVDKFSDVIEKERKDNAESLEKGRKDNFTALQYMVERMEAHVGVIADAIRLEFKSINERLEKQDRGNI